MTTIAEVRMMRVYAAIVRAAEADAVCPSHKELTDIAGGKSESTSARILHALQLRDMIKIDILSYGRRRVTITETGKQTAVPPKLTRILKQVVPHFEVVTRQYIDRNPCSFCGVNPAVGCKHTQRWAA